jgi:hypothetical protein
VRRRNHEGITIANGIAISVIGSVGAVSIPITITDTDTDTDTITIGLSIAQGDRG